MREWCNRLLLFSFAVLLAIGGVASSQTVNERQNFDKIKLGMTEAGVRQLLPSTPKQSTSPGGYKVLTWGSESNSISVLFADGRVSTIERGSKSVDIHWGRIIGLVSVVLVVVVGATLLVIRRLRARSGKTKS